MKIVYPSGGDLAAISAPMLAPPPPRLSMMICCPSASPRRVPMARPIVSVPPPGGNGRMKRIGRLGYCACEGANHAKPQIKQTHQTRKAGFIFLLLGMRCYGRQVTARQSGRGNSTARHHSLDPDIREPNYVSVFHDLPVEQCRQFLGTAR